MHLSVFKRTTDLQSPNQAYSYMNISVQNHPRRQQMIWRSWNLPLQRKYKKLHLKSLPISLRLTDRSDTGSSALNLTPSISPNILQTVLSSQKSSGLKWLRDEVILPLCNCSGLSRDQHGYKRYVLILEIYKPLSAWSPCSDIRFRSNLKMFHEVFYGGPPCVMFSMCCSVDVGMLRMTMCISLSVMLGLRSSWSGGEAEEPQK